MKPRFSHLAVSMLLVVPLCQAEQIYSWENGLDGWVAADGSSIATSTIGATSGVQSLAVTTPMTNMYYATPTSIGLDAAARQAIFTGATEITLDVSYPDPGYNLWVGTPDVEVIIQGETIPYTGLGAKAVAVGAAPVTLSWPLTVAQASGLAAGSWANIVLKFTYGNGGATSTNAIFYVDNLTSTIAVEPPPPSDRYWKGNVNDNWTLLNWTSDADGLVPAAALPNDGSVGVAFAATEADNLTTILGADQNVKSLVLTEGVGEVMVGGTHRLTIGQDGIWVSETAGWFTLENSGGVVLGTDQQWKNQSPNLMVVDTVVSGSGVLTKSGVGPIYFGKANLHDGGTVVEQGTLTMGDVLALGPVGSTLTMEGGTLDLNGFSPTLGDLAGGVGAVIQNSTDVPSLLTLVSETGSHFSCSINDGFGGGGVSFIKKGYGEAISGGAGNFTGSITIAEGQFTAQAAIYGAPTVSSFGNAQIAGRKIVVDPGAGLFFGTNNVLGNAATDMGLLPEVVLDQSMLNSNRYNLIGDVTLNAATMSQTTSDSGNYQGYQFKGRIKVTGTEASYLLSNGLGNHLSDNTVFEVENVTGDGEEDLVVSSPLIDQSGDFANAPGGFTKTGAGTMTLEQACSYTGNTQVQEGILSLEMPGLSDTGTVEVDAGAKIDLAFYDTDYVGALVLATGPAPVGVYGAPGSDAQFVSDQITGPGFIAVGITPDPYDDWIAGYPSLTGDETARNADPDHDGLTNLQEFAFNSIPNNGASSGNEHSRVESVGGGQAFVLTLPILEGAVFVGDAPATAVIPEANFSYQVAGSNDLITFDQPVTEILPALSTGLPALDVGWSYRSFRLNGDVGGTSSRGPRGFLRAAVVDTP